jgi:hypothetical protein
MNLMVHHIQDVIIGTIEVSDFERVAAQKRMEVLMGEITPSAGRRHVLSAVLPTERWILSDG